MSNRERRFGAEDYDLSAYLGTQKSVVIRVVQLPGSNALAAAEGTKAVMERLSKRFPPGLTYKFAYDPTEFIQRSIDEVVKTLFEAVLLVTLVVIVSCKSGARRSSRCSLFRSR